MYIRERDKNIWPKDSIKNTLSAIDTHNLGVVSPYDIPEVKIYRQGFEAAINAMAEAFHIKYVSPQADSIKTGNILDLSV